MNTERNTHSKLMGYLLWIFGFTGAHRFYFGKPITGTIWFFTFGLLGIGWLVDLFLIPSMDRRADLKYVPGPLDYSLAWLLMVFLGFFGVQMTFLHDSSPLSIGISLVIVVVAALNLVLDFDLIERGVAGGAPKFMEWYASFGLLVTLVWLYLEILRLLSKLQGRSRS